MNIDETLHDLVRPLETQLGALLETIEQSERELQEMRASRDRALRVLRLLAPERYAPQSKNDKPEYTPKPVSEEMEEKIRNFLKNTSGLPNNFTAASLLRDGWAGLPSQSTLNATLRVLHAKGELFLVGKGQGGAKVYRRAV